ncbi:MAG: NUDIX hydrolase [Actinobacteria bacterium]|nr:NUDIX hydrolase [Actinomycetota bacterium]
MPGGNLTRAAGVVLLRHTGPFPEVLVVHRPKYNDWSLPKGKLEPGEQGIHAAIRECEEETGFEAVLGPRLPSLHYEVEGVPKRVDFWAAHASSDEGFTPGAKIDTVHWIPADSATGTLTHASEASLVARAAALPHTSPLILLRHTEAAKRSDYRGKDDAERPLSGKGRSQAKALIPLLDAFGITDVHSSTSVRCQHSVRKFAKYLGTGVQHEPAMSEEGFEERPERTARRMRKMILDPAPLVLCSHRPLLPTLLDVAAEVLGTTEMTSEDPASDVENRAARWDPKLPPGGFIVLHRSLIEGSSPRLVAIERHVAADE